MSIEGRLQIQLSAKDGRVNRVGIANSRPLRATRIFAGKSVADLQRTLPLLYGVCATAQAHAAQLACDQARGVGVAPALLRAREMLVWTETAREHLGRILLDWSRFLGETPERRFAAPMMGLLAGVQGSLFADTNAFGDGVRLCIAPAVMEAQLSSVDALLGEMVFADPWPEGAGIDALYGWCEAGRSVAARFLREVLRRGWAGLGANPVAPLPELAEDALHVWLAGAGGEAFVAAPRWDGATCETGALVRQWAHPLVQGLAADHGNGLLTRLVARLAELALIPNLLHRYAETLSEASAPITTVPADGIGMAQVEAARGRLVHRVELRGGQVYRYQILAPTEWNFQSGGTLAQALLGLDASDEAGLREQAGVLIAAIDPCVGFDLTLS